MIGSLMIAGLSCWYAPVVAQTNTTWTGGSSNWNNAANWSFGSVPNNGGGLTWNVFIDGGAAGNSVVGLDISAAINQLNVSTGDILNILDNRTLSIVQNINNDGAINLQAGGNFTSLSFSGGSQVNGTGVISLSGINAQITGSGAFTQAVGHTIQGNGSIGTNSMFITNQGLFLANAGDNLTIDVANAGSGNAAFTNSGTVRATGGGIVTLTGAGAGEFQGSGVYEALAGSRIHLIQDVVLRNTNLSTAGSGTIRAISGQTASLVDVVNSGSIVREDNGTLGIGGTFTNSGSVSLTAAGNVTQISIGGTTSFTGGGTVTMSGTNAQIVGVGSTLTNVNNTIQGNGNAGANSLFINNQGLFLANTGDNLTIDVANAGTSNPGFTNSGTVRATGGGIVTLTGLGAGEFQGSGVYEALAGSRIHLIQDVVLRNTNLSTAGSGTIRAISGQSASLVDVVNSGSIVREDNGTLGIGGTFTNSGSVSLTAAGNATQISIGGTTSFTGGGTVTMSGTNAQIVGGGNTLTNVNNTIQGNGNAGANSLFINNQGLFLANTGSDNLTIDVANAGTSNPGFTNSGTVRATGGGVVTLTGAGAGEFHGASGGIFEAQVGSQIQLVSDAVVRNATFTTSGNGLIRLNGSNNATWDNVTNMGNFKKDDLGSLVLSNSLTNSGDMLIQGGGNTTQIYVAGAVNLSGGGTIRLAGTNARIAGGGAGDVLTNLNNTISGTGSLGANLARIINQGTVQAGGGENLVIDPANAGGGNPAFTNAASGIVRATGGGVVTLTGFGAGEFHGAPGGIFEAQAGSQIQLISDAVVRNATFTTSGSGLIRLNGGNSATWDNVTNTGNFKKDDLGSLVLSNSLTNSGDMLIEGGGNTTQIYVAGAVNLSGGGTIRLAGTNARIAGGGAGDVLTNVNNTISGTGSLGANAAIIINQGTVQAGGGENLVIDPANAGGGNPAFTNAASGIVRATGGGTVTLTGSGGGEFSGAGTFESLNSNLLFDGSAVVQNVTGGVLGSGTWRAIDGGVGANLRVLNDATSLITTIGSNAAVELSGVNSRFTVRSSNTPIDSSLSTVQGNLTLRNGRVMNTSGPLANSGNVVIDGASTVLGVNGAFTQTAGTTVLNNQALLAVAGAGNSVVSGGVFSGNGTVSGNFDFGVTSILDPGLSAGRLDFSNELIWSPGARIRFDLGVNAAASDLITVSSLLNPNAGTREFTFIDNGWVVGQTYDLIDFATTNFGLSEFAYTNALPFQGEFLFNGSLLQFRVNAVPEPSTAGILTMVASMICLRRRRSNG